MKYKFYSVLFTSLISVVSLQAQSSMRNEATADNYYTQMSLASPIDEHKSLLVELDSIRKHVDNKVDVSIEDANILRRMKASVKTVPLDYNSQVKYYIDKYVSSNYRPYMNRLHGLSKYYFSAYDKILGEMGIPQEVKYLSLVESSLNPHLVSSAGAVGPWQFIYSTARIYDLDMNSHFDERKDIYSATYALSKYLQESYNQFNDWLLAIASYNCGRGCVKRAIERSGLHNPSFWELSPYLPKETQNYIPKYVAMTYVMSNAASYGIEAIATELDYETKIVMVDKTVDLRHIAQAINMDISSLKHFNPAYKKNTIPGTLEKPKRLYLPVTSNVNDSLLYVALNSPSAISSKEEPEQNIADAFPEKYKVKRGETLVSVSRKFGVSVQNLKAWNGLRNNSAVVGRSLVVAQPVNATLAKNISKTAAKKESSRTAFYVVKKGDSLDRIAKQFNGSTVSKIKQDNNLKNSMIKPGMKLKIRKG